LPHPAKIIDRIVQCPRATAQNVIPAASVLGSLRLLLLSSASLWLSPATVFMRIVAIALAATLTLVGGCHKTHLAKAPKQSFRDILGEYVVNCNGKIVSDARKSEVEEWDRMLKSESVTLFPHIVADVLADETLFRIVVIREFNREYIVFLARDLSVIRVCTVHDRYWVPDSGPNHLRQTKRGTQQPRI
jgi:hypothetical protein